MIDPLLSVRKLCVEFPSRRGTVRALDEVSFDVMPGEVLGLVGELGAGKSITGAAIVGLIEPPGHISGGKSCLAEPALISSPRQRCAKYADGALVWCFKIH